MVVGYKKQSVIRIQDSMSVAAPFIVINVCFIPDASGSRRQVSVIIIIDSTDIHLPRCISLGRLSVFPAKRPQLKIRNIVIWKIPIVHQPIIRAIFSVLGGAAGYNSLHRQYSTAAVVMQRRFDLRDLIPCVNLSVMAQAVCAQFGVEDCPPVFPDGTLRCFRDKYIQQSFAYGYTFGNLPRTHPQVFLIYIVFLLLVNWSFTNRLKTAKSCTVACHKKC